MRFWDASGVCLRLLYKLSTVRVFLTDTDLSENLSTQGEEEWPPLRKVSWEPGNQGHGEPSWDRPVTTHGSPSLGRWALLIPTVMILGWASRRSSSVNTVATWLWQARQGR